MTGKLCALAMFAALLASSLFAQAQTTAPADSTSALTAALSAACRQDDANFSNYLTAANSAAFRKLSSDERTSLMERFVLLDAKGRPLLSTNTDGSQSLRCEATDASQTFNFAASAVHDNLANISVTASTGETIRFGLVKEDGGWKLLSIGLLLIDIPELQKQWDVQALQAREQSAIDTLHALAEAVSAYQQDFGKLPERIAQLGPPPANGGVSPDGAKLIGADLAGGATNGYNFRYRVITPADSGTPGFEIAAVPAQYGKSGKRSFLLDKSGNIHAADKRGAVATIEDPILPAQPPETN